MMTGPLRPMRDGSDHPQTSFVRHGDFPSPTVNHVRQSLLRDQQSREAKPFTRRDAHRGHRHALGANVDPLQDLGVSPVKAESPLNWKERLGLPSSTR
jgi:hypothetical protein